jgi:hypothetical protein
MPQRISALSACLVVGLLSSLHVLAQSDPGPRPGSAAAGSYYPTLNSNEQALFNQAVEDFMETIRWQERLQANPVSV